MRIIDDLDKEAINKCKVLGFSPKVRPLGKGGHHSDMPILKQDKVAGEALAYFLGTMWNDISDSMTYNWKEDLCQYWYFKRTSVDEWSRVARALRIHGLCIRNIELETKEEEDD